MLHQKITLDKNKIIEEYKDYNFFKNSIASLKAEQFKIFRSKDYSKELKFSITTILFDSKNDDFRYHQI